MTVWHAGLWQVFRSFNVEKGLVQVIKALHEISCNTDLLNRQLGEFFKTTVGVCQECLLSSILFNFFLEKIMQETLHDHHTSISTGGRPVCNLSFADNIDLMGGNNGELQDLTNRLVDRTKACGMEVSTEKTKILANRMSNTSADISMNDQEVRGGDQFQVLGSNPVQRWHLYSRNLHQG